MHDSSKDKSQPGSIFAKVGMAVAVTFIGYSLFFGNPISKISRWHRQNQIEAVVSMYPKAESRDRLEVLLEREARFTFGNIAAYKNLFSRPEIVKLVSRSGSYEKKQVHYAEALVDLVSIIRTAYDSGGVDEIKRLESWVANIEDKSYEAELMRVINYAYRGARYSNPLSEEGLARVDSYLLDDDFMHQLDSYCRHPDKDAIYKAVANLMIVGSTSGQGDLAGDFLAVLDGASDDMLFAEVVSVFAKEDMVLCLKEKTYCNTREILDSYMRR